METPGHHEEEAAVLVSPCWLPVPRLALPPLRGRGHWGGEFSTVVLANVGAACCSLQPQEEQIHPARSWGVPTSRILFPISPEFPPFMVPSCSPRDVSLYFHFHLSFAVAEESSTSVPGEEEWSGTPKPSILQTSLVSQTAPRAPN